MYSFSIDSMFQISLSDIIRTDAAGYQHLVEIYETIMAQSDMEVTLGFDDCVHMDANLSAVLGSLLDDLKMHGYDLWLTTPKAPGVRDNLSRNKFFRAFNPDCADEDPENFIEYRRFRRDEGNEFKTYIETQLMQKQRFPAHTEKAGALIHENIMEIFVNAVLHGECAYVYSCGEYDRTKKPPSLDMTIVDLGYSIPAKVNGFIARLGKNILPPCDAIRWALRDGNTTKNIPGGLGFTLLLNFLRMNRGAMQIVSGSGMVEFRNGELIDYSLAKPLRGTIVNMEFNFNDNKNYRLVSEQVDRENLL